MDLFWIGSRVKVWVSDRVTETPLYSSCNSRSKHCNIGFLNGTIDF